MTPNSFGDPDDPKQGPQGDMPEKSPKDRVISLLWVVIPLILLALGFWMMGR